MGAPMVVLDYNTICELVAGASQPKWFAMHNLKHHKSIGSTVLLPTATYISMYRSKSMRLHIRAVTDLHDVRQYVNLSNVDTRLVSTAETFHQHNSGLDILDCIGAATALDKNCPLAVMKIASYKKLISHNGLTVEEWWKYP